MRGVIYCRVSTKEQVDNLSLATQEKVCCEYCAHQGIEVAEVFIDKGESAKTVDRPEFQRLLKYCHENKGQVQYVVVYSLSRFARDAYSHLVTTAYLKKFGVTLRSATEPIAEDSSGKLMENILAAFAQFDNNVRAERTVAGMKAAIECGRWVHKAPLGYVNRVDASGKPTMVPDPRNSALIRKAFELFATGKYTKEQVRRAVTDLGLKTLAGKEVSPQTFDRLVRNPIYSGWVEEKQWKIRARGAFEALIDDETFDQVQAIISGRRPTATPYVRNHPDFPLRAFVRCGKCGTPLTGSWSKGRNKKYAYYRCPGRKCKAVNVAKDELEGGFVSFLEKLRPKPEYIASGNRPSWESLNPSNPTPLNRKRCSGSEWGSFRNEKPTSLMPSSTRIFLKSYTTNTSKKS